MMITNQYVDKASLLYCVLLSDATVPTLVDEASVIVDKGAVNTMP